MKWSKLKHDSKYQVFITILCFIQVISLCSCNNGNTKLKRALELSGTNRNELEQVIRHYSNAKNDSLKLKAALFLIENMPGHITLIGDYIYNNNDEIDSARGNNTFFEKKVFKMLPLRNSLVRGNLQAKEDVHHIKAEYLIHHIDKCFELWNTLPWLSSLSLNDFLEYLLPYRVEEEVLDDWIDSCAIAKEELQDIINYYDDIKRSITGIGNYMYRYVDGATLSYKDSTKKAYYADCADVSLIKLFKYRSLGIPCAIDYVPCWSGSTGAHHWIRVIDPMYKDSGVPQVYHRTAKVYRRTFSINKYSEEASFVSYLFKDAFNQDVTNQYIITSDITVPCSQRSLKIGYLAVFYKQNWTPVDWGYIKDNRIEFTKMGRDVVYLPVYYKNMNMYNMGYPFLIDGKGDTHTFIPDKNDLQQIRLTRKYPSNINNSQLGIQLIGSYWVGANQKNYKDSIILHRIERNPGMNHIIKQLTEGDKYRYFKCVFPESISIAELHFFDHEKEITGKILTSSKSEESYLNDNDPLTYFEVHECLEIDFSTPRNITKISFLSRNDGNGIYPENEYELLYFDFNGWQSLGIKKGNDFCLEYDNVPSNALLWLRNLTTGVEERIFTYNDGQVTFW